VSTTPLVLETVTRTALLGVRFWDRVTGRVVVDGLEVMETTSGTRLLSSRSGVFALHELPGLRASAFGSGDDAFWSSPPAVSTIGFTVVDTTRQFLPFAFTTDVPFRGLLAEDCGLDASPPDAVVGGVPLFSAPSRIAPAGVAAVRADLWDVDANAPAAWAVLEVSAGSGPVYRGVADANGRTVVLLPYPEPPWHGSSPPPGSHALSEQTWPLTIGVRYAPAQASPPLPAPSPDAVPDLCAVLTQPAGTLLAADSPSTALGSQLLAFGRELVLRTPGQSVLHVLPA
jgi:hypothetical protein